MSRIALVLLLGVLPRVEDPWPDTIGLELPIALAGAIGILAGVVFSGSPELRRDRAIRWGGVLGFLAGMLFYLAALVAQLCSVE
jgi:hypothetical protein